jgi:hypothetical protein
MPGALIEVVFLSLEKDGRNSLPHLKESYRPHFRVNNGEYLGVSFIDAVDPVLFDTSLTAQVNFLYHSKVNYDALQVGVEFEILEGPNIIGYGRVVGLF